MFAVNRLYLHTNGNPMGDVADITPGTSTSQNTLWYHAGWVDFGAKENYNKISTAIMNTTSTDGS